MTLLDVQAVTDIDPSNLSKMESGKQPVSAKTLQSLATVYGIDVNLLRTGTWDNPLDIFQYPTNPHPYRLEHIVIDRMSLLYGNRTEPIDLSLSYEHRPIELHKDLKDVYADLVEKVEADAKERGITYFNGPNTRLHRLVNTPRGAEEAHAARLELAPVSWEEFCVLNGSMDEVVWPEDEAKTIRKRFADEQTLYREQCDLSWCPLSNILTVLLTPITSDGYGLVQRRSKKTVAHAVDKFSCGISENINRFLDEAPISQPHVRVNRMQPVAGKLRDHTYMPGPRHAPSPLLCGLRGIYEELSVGLYDEIVEVPGVIKFLNLGFDLVFFQPVLLGVVDLPLTRHEVETFIQTSPGRDKEWTMMHYLPLDARANETRRFVNHQEHWDVVGLASFVSAVSYYQHRRRGA